MLLHTEELAPSGRCIQEGDLAIVYERYDSMRYITVTQNGVFNNKYGNFPMKDWIGRPFGSCVRAKQPGNGWVYVLAPTPELWTQVLRHRTQILYVADISMVCSCLELAPGCTVLESGTGSGSLTTSLARAVAPTGHVHTFEFHEHRAGAAAEEFKANGLDGLVSVAQRDIEAQGFPEDLHGRADAVFLDLPGPWKVVPSASRCLRPDGVFCSFSPCIEQVQRTCEALNANGFREMRTMEVLLRQYDVSWEHLVADLDGSTQQQQGKQQQSTQQLSQQEQQAEQQSEQQVAQGSAEGRPSKRSKTEGSQDSEPGGVGGEGAQEPGADGVPMPGEGQGVGGQAAGGPGAGGEGGTPAQGGGWGAAQRQRRERRVLARPVPQGRGHTGYLTFARKAVAE